MLPHTEKILPNRSFKCHFIFSDWLSCSLTIDGSIEHICFRVKLSPLHLKNRLNPGKIVRTPHGKSLRKFMCFFRKNLNLANVQGICPISKLLCFCVIYYFLKFFFCIHVWPYIMITMLRHIGAAAQNVAGFSKLFTIVFFSKANILIYPEK